MSLTELANIFGTDKGDSHHEAHNYTPVFESYIKRDEPYNLLEIGVNDPRFPGASLKMWDDYLTDRNTVILGLDINPPDISSLSPRVSVVQADQSSPSQLLSVYNYCSYFDIIIDDGLHTFEHQMASFLTLFPVLSPKGVYFIEDCHAKDCHRTIEWFKSTTPYLHFDIEEIKFTNNDKLITIIKS